LIVVDCNSLPVAYRLYNTTVDTIGVLDMIEAYLVAEFHMAIVKDMASNKVVKLFVLSMIDCFC